MSNTTVVGDSNEVIGDGNTVRGIGCKIYGHRNNVRGNFAVVHGDDCVVSGNSPTVYGNRNAVNGDFCAVSGDHNLVFSHNGNVRGAMNTVQGDWVTVRGRQCVVLGYMLDVQGEDMQSIDLPGTQLLPPLPPMFAQPANPFATPSSLFPASSFGSFDTEYVELPAEEQGSPPKENEKECVVCFENAVTTVLYRCGHSVLCVSCARRIVTEGSPKCPMCKAQITAVIKLFTR